MADKSLIEWTDATWNPITGCSVVSPGCKHCYAMKLAGGRLRNHPSRMGLTAESKAGPVWTGEVRFNERMLLEPLRWSKPRKIFVCAHGDLFAEGVPDEWIDRVFAVMALCPQHMFQVLTKRPERMREYLLAKDAARRAYEKVCDLTLENLLQVILLLPGMADPGLNPAAPRIHLDVWPLPNLWLGVSAENEHWAQNRIPVLLDTPAVKRFVSLEPLLGPIDLEPYVLPPSKWSNGWLNNYPLWYPKAQLDWVIVGGESGVGARPMSASWARSLRDQCAAASVPFFFKQWGNWIDADEWFDRMERSGAFVTVRGAIFQPPRPLNYEHAAQLAPEVEHEHHSDGTTSIDVGKRIAGRLLDGVEHNGMPGTAN